MTGKTGLASAFPDKPRCPLRLLGSPVKDHEITGRQRIYPLTVLQDLFNAFFLYGFKGPVGLDLTERDVDREGNEQKEWKGIPWKNGATTRGALENGT
jgi:hypothetical protein